MFLVPVALAGPSMVCPEAAKLGWREEGGALYDPASLEVAGEPSLVAMGHFAQLVDILRGRGAAVAVVLLPSRPVGFRPPETWDLMLDRRKYVATQEWLRSTGAIVPDVWALARKGAFYMPEEGHWTPQAARATAELLRAEVGALPGLGTEPHETRELKPSRPQPGLLSKRLAAICGTVPAESARPRFQTTGPALGLLDEAPPPPIAMIAPSYGDEEFNFGGALADVFDASVLPVAVHGGMVMSGMQTWMQSENYASGATKLVVWVVQIGHLYGVGGGNDRVSLADGEGWRQVLGRARGGCDVAEGPYLQLDGAGLAGARFTTRITHTDGSVDEVETIPDPRVPASPRQFLELRRSAVAPVALVSVDVPDVTVRACGAGPSTVAPPPRMPAASPSLCPAAEAAGWTAAEGAIFPPGPLSPAVRADIESLGFMSRMLRGLRGRGIEVDIGLLPTRAGAFVGDGARTLGGRAFSLLDDRERYFAVATWLRAQGATVPDVWALARTVPDFYAADDPGWTPTGGRMLGEALGYGALRARMTGEYRRRVAELCGVPAPASAPTEAPPVDPQIVTVTGPGPMLPALRAGLGALGTAQRFVWTVPISQVVGEQSSAEWRQLLPDAEGACTVVASGPGPRLAWSGAARGHFVEWQGGEAGTAAFTHADGSVDTVAVKRGGARRRLEFDQSAASPIIGIEVPGRAVRVCRYGAASGWHPSD